MRYSGLKVWIVLILALAASHTVCDEALAFVPAGLRLSGAKMRGYRDCSIAQCSGARRGIGRVRIAGGLLCTGGEGESAGSLAATPTKGKVKCIFSDVDGTVLDKHHRLQPLKVTTTHAAHAETYHAHLCFFPSLLALFLSLSLNSLS